MFIQFCATSWCFISYLVHITTWFQKSIHTIHNLIYFGCFLVCFAIFLLENKRKKKRKSDNDDDDDFHTWKRINKQSITNINLPFWHFIHSIELICKIGLLNANKTNFLSFFFADFLSFVHLPAACFDDNVERARLSQRLRAK